MAMEREIPSEERRRVGGWRVAILPVVLIIVLIAPAAIALGIRAMEGPSPWERVERGTLLGRSIADFPGWDADPAPVLAGWDVTYTTGGSFDVAEVTAVRRDERGVVIGCANALVNIDVPGAWTVVEWVRVDGDTPQTLDAEK